jgi:hypothetical protein
VDIVTQNQQTVKCELLTDSGRPYKRAVDIVTPNQQTVQSQPLTDSGHIAEDNIGHSNRTNRQIVSY